MTIAQLIEDAFRGAAARHGNLHATWGAISRRIGGRLPASLLMVSVQRLGELDLVLRSLEDELSGQGEEPGFSAHYLAMFSEIWIGSAYEIVRLLKARKLAHESEEFRRLLQDLTLLRVPIEQHEITRDNKLSAPIELQRQPPRNDESDRYAYDKGDPARAHIMPSGITGRGSMMWQVLDHQSGRWLDRGDLSDRLIAIWRHDADRTTTVLPPSNDPAPLGQSTTMGSNQGLVVAQW